MGNPPEKGGGVLATVTVEGAKLGCAKFHTLELSGYRWELRQTASSRGGTKNAYDPANGWTDEDGRLHLRITKRGEEWTSAEATLTHSLGYGTYRVVTREMSHLQPAMVFSIFTWDELGPPREMNIELSRWSETR